MRSLSFLTVLCFLFFLPTSLQGQEILRDIKLSTSQPAKGKIESVSQPDPQEILRKLKQLVRRAMRQLEPWIREIERSVKRALKDLERLLFRFKKGEKPSFRTKRDYPKKSYTPEPKKNTPIEPKKVSPPSGSLTMPPLADREKLAQDSLLAFNQAIQKQNFTEFHKDLCKQFKERFTPERLKTIFQKFIDQKLNLEGIKGKKPVFTNAPILFEKQKAFVLQGYFQGGKEKVYFRLIYTYEDSNWKLMGITVRVA